ncbi:MAG: 16S rRNA (guanine(966)-N(2))-methyltransferase RsmD [Candidatus Nanopelagicales bacterium]
MSRIIAGAAKGRALVVPKSGTRPTSDRVKESLFSMLDARINDWSSQIVLDLFAGSGALGLEAISRGARSATLVDNAQIAISAMAKNVRSINAPAISDHGDSVEVVKADSARWLDRDLGRDKRYSLVFLDPPYELENDEVEKLVAKLVTKDLLIEDALVVIERSARGEKFTFPESDFELVADKKYGDTTVIIGLFIG